MDASLAPSDSYIVLVYFGLHTSDSNGLSTVTPWLWQRVSLKRRSLDYLQHKGLLITIQSEAASTTTLVLLLVLCFLTVFPTRFFSETPPGMAAAVLDTSGR